MISLEKLKGDLNYFIREAEGSLGKPLPGSKLDLIADNFDLSLRTIQNLLIETGHRCAFCEKDKDPGSVCKNRHEIPSPIYFGKLNLDVIQDEEWLG